MNHPYLSSASLKALARGQLMGHYGTVVGAYLIHMLCILPFTLTIVILFAENTLFNFILSTAASFLISLVSGLFVAGEAYMYLKIACNQPVSVGDLFYCFQHENTKVLNIQAVMAGVSILTTLPAAILGFISPLLPDSNMWNTIYIVLYIAGLVVDYIISLMLSQTYFLMLDFPEYTPSKLLKMSIQIMKKNKGRLFYISLSFFPLIFVGYLSCGIGLLWVQPYIQATEANFYLDLIKKKTA